jgi:hypothetical protein
MTGEDCILIFMKMIGRITVAMIEMTGDVLTHMPMIGTGIVDMIEMKRDDGPSMNMNLVASSLDLGTVVTHIITMIDKDEERNGESKIVNGLLRLIHLGHLTYLITAQDFSMNPPVTSFMTPRPSYIMGINRKSITSSLQSLPLLFKKCLLRMALMILLR